MNAVSLEEEEGDALLMEEPTSENNDLHQQGFNPALCAVGKFISEGKVDFLAMQHTLTALWKPGKGVFIKELDVNLYLFQFYHEIDVKRVLEGCPWSFNRRALVMSRIKERENPRCVDLSSMDLWVQVHDLKTGFMSEKLLTGIGNYIGSFLSSCPTNFTGVWRDYMRIRVTINLNAPLKRRMKIKMTGNEWYWINFKYENVPTFCFICGIIGHSERFCGRLFDVPETDIVKPYGSWMRASFKGHVKPIGAKWLRLGHEGGGSGAGKEPYGGHTVAEENTNHDPLFTPADMEIVNQGVLSGISKFQNNVTQAGKKSATIPTNQASGSERLNADDILIIDTKKRKTNNGLDTNAEHEVGLNRNIQMLVDNEDQTSDSETENGSKNGYVAGTHGSARQSL